MFTVIRADRLPEKLKGFRVLAIDGKKPGQEGYPLVQRPNTSALAAR